MPGGEGVVKEESNTRNLQVRLIYMILFRVFDLIRCVMISLRKLLLIAAGLGLLATAVVAGAGALGAFNKAKPLEGISVAVGGAHTCAIDMHGAAVCWGFNYSGELGNGDSGEHASQTSAVQVVGLETGVSAISAAYGVTCAVQLGAAKCWGDNSRGRLGNGTTDDSSVPVQVAGLDHGVSSIGVGQNTVCAVTEAGGVYCWGYNGHIDAIAMIPCCMLGDGTTEQYRLVPTPVVGLSSGVKSIAVGEYHTCALTVTGAVGCWGTYHNPRMPTKVTGLPDGISSISASGNSTCAISNQGALLCWGYNHSGQLGDGSTIDRASRCKFSAWIVT